MNAIVLAAGLSSRMGAKNKMLLPYGESTIIEHTLSQITAFPFTRIIVVIGNDHEAITSHIKNFPIEIVHNPHYASGQVSSVQAGLKMADGDMPFMVALGDMPLILTSMYRSLIDQFLEYNDRQPSILRPVTHDGTPGNPVIFDQSFRSALLSNDDPESSRKVIRKNKDALVMWKTHEAAYFSDIDTPEDYEKLNSSG